MSDMTFTERKKLEELFQMEGGSVLDFTDRTFAEFVRDSVGLNIDDPIYHYGNGSTANRLRRLWMREPDHVVGRLLQALLDYCRPKVGNPTQERLLEECQLIADRLELSNMIGSVDDIIENRFERRLEKLERQLKRYLAKGEPEIGLDRLHPLVTALVHEVAQSRGVVVDPTESLHSIFGEYLKEVCQATKIGTGVTEPILKSSVSIMEAFDWVCNAGRLAQVTPLLSEEESTLLCEYVLSTLKFIRALESWPYVY